MMDHGLAMCIIPMAARHVGRVLRRTGDQASGLPVQPERRERIWESLERNLDSGETSIFAYCSLCRGANELPCLWYHVLTPGAGRGPGFSKVPRDFVMMISVLLGIGTGQILNNRKKKNRQEKKKKRRRQKKKTRKNKIR